MLSKEHENQLLGFREPNYNRIREENRGNKVVAAILEVAVLAVRNRTTSTAFFCIRKVMQLILFIHHREK